MKNHLQISWAVSRGQDTYGYNICRLDSHESGKRYRCMGGGYDMLGTVVGKWLQTEHQNELQDMASQRLGEQVNCGYVVEGYKRIEALYGLEINPVGQVRLDGACGFRSMEAIAEAIGLKLIETRTRQGKINGFIVE